MTEKILRHSVFIWPEIFVNILLYQIKLFYYKPSRLTNSDSAPFYLIQRSHVNGPSNGDKFVMETK